MKFLCKIGLHKWEEIGWSDKILYGRIIAFVGKYTQRCKRCGVWELINPIIPIIERFYLEEQDIEVQKKLIDAVMKVRENKRSNKLKVGFGLFG